VYQIFLILRKVCCRNLKSFSVFLTIFLTILGWAVILCLVWVCLKNGVPERVEWFLVFCTSFLMLYLGIRTFNIVIPREKDILKMSVNILFAVAFFVLWEILFYNSLPYFVRKLFTLR